ncbi:MAG: hypothetical protein ACI9BK_003136, partial [Acidimicrobiales bacterium]
RDERVEPTEEATRTGKAISGERRPERSGSTQVGARDERVEPTEEATRTGKAISGERRPERSGSTNQLVIGRLLRVQGPLS